MLKYIILLAVGAGTQGSSAGTPVEQSLPVFALDPNHRGAQASTLRLDYRSTIDELVSYAPALIVLSERAVSDKLSRTIAAARSIVCAGLTEGDEVSLSLDVDVASKEWAVAVGGKGQIAVRIKCHAPPTPPNSKP